MKQSATDNSRKTVCVVSTGGTIISSGATANQLTGYCSQGLTLESAYKGVESLLSVNTEFIEAFHIPSSCIQIKHWLKLAEIVDRLVHRPDVLGVVVTHGTDTMEESAFFLDLVLKTKKPVVFTGSMRPATALSADGALNLLNSIKIASSQESSGRGVLICMNCQIGEARFVVKTHTLSVETFQPNMAGFCGYIIGNELSFFHRPQGKKYLLQHDLEYFVNLKEWPFVPIVTSYAGETDLFIRAATEAGAKGIVYAGCGHGSVTEVAEAALGRALKKGVCVVRSSRVQGPVLEGKSRWTQEGMIPAGNLPSSKARLVLLLAIADVGADREKISHVFREINHDYQCGLST